MKKVFLSMALGLLTLSASAQKQVTLKSGTPVSLQAVDSIWAADAAEGQIINFRVSQDVLTEGVVAISRGAVAKGKVVDCRKSTIAGTKGRLVINLTEITLANGENISLAGSDVRIYGKNRTPLAVVAAILTGGWGILLPGTKAVMPANYETQAMVASNVTITIN